MAVIGGTLGRLPAAVFVLVALIVIPMVFQAGGVQPNDVQAWLNGKVLYDIELVVVLMPLLIALAGLIAIVFMVTSHHVGAGIAAGIGVGFLVIDFVWHFGLGVWAVAHLTGKA